MAALNRRVASITKTIETKSGVQQIADGTEYLHNTMYVISNTFLRTAGGTTMKKLEWDRESETKKKKKG